MINVNRFQYVFTGLGLLTIFLVTQILNADEMQAGLNTNSFLSLIAIFVSLIMLAFSLSTHAVQFNSALFWIFQYVFFGLTPLSYSLDLNPYFLARLISESSFNAAYMISTLSLFLISISQFWCFKRGLERPVISKSKYASLEMTYIFRLKVLTVLYLILLFPVSASLGGYNYFFQPNRKINIIQTQNIANVSINESLLQVIPLVIFLSLVVLKFKYKSKVSSIWILLIGLLVLFLANPQAHPRQLVLFLLIPIIFLLSKRYVNAIIVFILLLPLVLIYASNIIDRRTGDLTWKIEFTPPSRNGDFDAFAQLGSGLDKIPLGVFPIMKQILGSLFFFVPRSIWTDKPFDTGVVLANSNGLFFKNLSAPWILEILVNFRFVGLATFCIFLGIYLGRSIFLENISPKSLVWAGIISGSMFILLRGSLLQATGRFVFSYFLIHIIFRTKRMHPQRIYNN